ncbi:hypothetical protein BC826DRAFT_970295 [Russula brevipes]|nr:hypothetical protein BC826DRAFT_970295 [Russula brevipes]
MQEFDKTVQELKCMTQEEFIECLRGSGSDDVFPSEIPESPRGLSIDGFCDLVNDIAQSIKARRFPNDHDDPLVFKETERKIPNEHVMDTTCRPDITAAFEKDWKGINDDCTEWALIRLAGEKASRGKTHEAQQKNAATYLHYLLLARPDFLVAQGLLTTDTGVMLLLGTGGVGIQQLTVEWTKRNDLYKLLYAFIYRLYSPCHFEDPSYTRTGFNEKTREATYTVRMNSMDYTDFRALYAKNPFATRTHVLSKPSSKLMSEGDDRPLTVLKDRLCRIGRRFDERTILSKIHKRMRVPGVVEAVDSEIIGTPLSPGRVKHRLGLRQTGSPFTGIPTAKKVLETLFDVLEVLRFLRFDRRILHRDVSAGNVMYIENPEIPEENSVVRLFFAKYLLGESKVPQETSLLLVDFNFGEDLDEKTKQTRIERTGTPIFISRAVERGEPVPLNTLCVVPKVPKSPECYTSAHSSRIADFPEEIKELVVDPDELTNEPQDNNWRHELNHDVESVFWLFLYWAMVAQPEKRRGECINSGVWGLMLGDHNTRDGLVISGLLSSGDAPENLTHSVYKPLWPLIKSLAAILVVDNHYLPESDVRKRPEYVCEAFQRLILQFIISNHDKDFMTCRVDRSLRRVQGAPQPDGLTVTPTQQRDGSDRAEVKRRRLDRT